MNVNTLFEHHSSELQLLLAQLIRIDEALRHGGPVPALSQDQTQHLILVVTDALLSDRRRRLALAL